MYFPVVSSLLIRFSLLFIDLALTVDNLMFFTISSLLSSVVLICLKVSYVYSSCCALAFTFLDFLVLLFHFSS